jgi:hypothetical protein
MKNAINTNSNRNGKVLYVKIAAITVTVNFAISVIVGINCIFHINRNGKVLYVKITTVTATVNFAISVIVDINCIFHINGSVKL